MVEVRQHTDGRTALRTPHTVDDLRKGDCNWMVIEYYSPTDARIRIDLLTDDEVNGDGWTPAVPHDDAAVRVLAESLLATYSSQYTADHLSWKDFEDEARGYLQVIAARSK